MLADKSQNADITMATIKSYFRTHQRYKRVNVLHAKQLGLTRRPFFFSLSLSFVLFSLSLVFLTRNKAEVPYPAVDTKEKGDGLLRAAKGHHSTIDIVLIDGKNMQQKKEKAYYVEDTVVRKKGKRFHQQAPFLFFY